MARPKKLPEPADLTLVKRYPYTRRTNKTSIRDLGRPFDKLAASDFLGSLPKFLKASDFIEFIKLIVKARRRNKPFHLMLGAHTIKVGLSPIIIDLMKRDIVTGLSFNSAGLLHDVELAFYGGTSEDVQSGLSDGTFGMVQETGQMFSDICRLAEGDQIGLGEAAGKYINANKARHGAYSLFAQAQRMKIPVTVHVGIGTDIVAQHPEFDGALAGKASHLDFKILATICSAIDRGGVLANIGSAVILPEVFLKALTVARNLSQGKSRLTTANFDMIMHYRPMENIVARPTYKAGKGFNFVGHHEIMIPLLAWGLKASFRK